MAGEKSKIVIVIEGVEELKPKKAEDKSPTKKQKKNQTWFLPTQTKKHFNLLITDTEKI